jgi:hypothetical protein
VQEEEFSIICYSLSAISTLDEKPSMFISDKPIFSSERILHKDYYGKGSIKKKGL